MEPNCNPNPIARAWKWVYNFVMKNKPAKSKKQKPAKAKPPVKAARPAKAPVEAAAPPADVLPAAPVEPQAEPPHPVPRESDRH